MKHGRRHDSLKERTYRERAAQDAPGYKRPFAPIPVAEPTGEHRVEPAPPPALADVLSAKAKRALKRAGVE